MNLQERLEVLVRLGEFIQSDDEYLQAVVQRSYRHHQWFTVENQQLTLANIAQNFLQRPQLEQWVTPYAIQTNTPERTVAVITANNVPLAGFHDVLSVFVAGHKCMLKVADESRYLFPHLIKILRDLDVRTEAYFELVPRLQQFDAVLATGSGKSIRYLETYFGKYPSIVRKNRNSIAILDGTESSDDLHRLGKDIFRYFGRSSRSVSKIYVPKGYDFVPFLEAMHQYNQIVLHSKYKNNFDYHYAMYILNKMEYMANGCILILENEAIASPVSNLYYEYYEDRSQLLTNLEKRTEEIQSIVNKEAFGNFVVAPFGEANTFKLSDYENHVDTLAFLEAL